MKKATRNRPTEIVSGVALAGAVTAALAPVLPTLLAVVVGAVCGLGPIVVSRFVDALRRR
jgi:hypothetical protein